MKNLVIFGTGKIGECLSYYFERDGGLRIVAYCVDREFLKEETFFGCPVVAFEDVERLYPADRHAMFVALGYHKINRLRRQKCEEAAAKGYELASYVSPQVTGKFTIGANSMVLDGATIQPLASIGNDVLVWGGAMIGHHARIGDHCWITGGANIGGLADIGEECFFGLNATIGHEVSVGARSILGAGSLVTKSIPAESVVVVRDTERHRLNSEQFLRLTKVF